MAESISTERVEACTEHLKCKKDCRRKTVFKSPKWFEPWLTGNPNLEEICNSQLKNKVDINELFKGL